MQIEITSEFLQSQGFSKTLPKRFWEKVNKNGPIPDPIKYPALLTPCWVWTHSTASGYGYLGRGKNHKNITAHRLSWILNVGIIPAGKYVLHKCDNRPCVNPNHLMLGTKKENTQDMIEKGRKNPAIKLSDEQVREILSLKGTQSQNGIARMFGVAGSYINRLFKGTRRQAVTLNMSNH